MHVTLCEIQGLVHRNRMKLAVRLRLQKSLEEIFDRVLTGCRITLDALTLEIDDLLKAARNRTFGFEELNLQSTAQCVWKKGSMENLMKQMRNQRGYILFLITILQRSVPSFYDAGTSK